MMQIAKIAACWFAIIIIGWLATPPNGKDPNRSPEASAASALPERITSDTKAQAARVFEIEPSPGSWPDWVIVAFTAALVYVAFQQHRLETRTARETKDALEIARTNAAAAANLAKTSAENVELARSNAFRDSRAWITFEPKLNGNVNVNDKGISASLSINVSNVGKLPADDVRISTKLFVTDGEGDQPNVLDRFALEELWSPQKLRGTMVVPGSTVPLTSLATCAAAEYRNFPHWEKTGRVLVGVAICATYRIASSDALHQTSMGYWLGDGRIFLPIPTVPAQLDGKNFGLGRFEGGKAF